jgi:hypothetical protein
VPGMTRLRKNPRHWIGIADEFPQGLKPESFYGLYRLDSSHPSDEDLSLGTPGSRALIQSLSEMSFSTACETRAYRTGAICWGVVLDSIYKRARG